MKQTPDHLRLFTRWHFYGVLVAFLLALHGSAMAAPQILVAHPGVHGLAQELVRLLSATKRTKARPPDTRPSLPDAGWKRCKRRQFRQKPC